MPEILFPYGQCSMSADIPFDRFAGTLESGLHAYQPLKGEWELVSDALAHPVAGPSLAELSQGKKKVVLIASDHTRPVPSKIIVPQMLAEIRKGNPSAEITILIATGCHRETTKAELRNKFGDEIFEKERILVHDCDDTANLVNIGKLPSGGNLVVNRIACEADLLVSEGFIEPHFFAGFSGGRKSVLPGIASRKTVMYNHNAAFIASPYARTGNLKHNPIHEDMLFASKAAGLAFICNVVLDPEKHICYAVAGSPEEAHEDGCAFLKKLCAVKKTETDIVITSNGGYPLDQNIYQAVKGMTAAEACVKEGGVIIMLAKSNDGDGGKSFHETFRNQPDLQKMMAQFLATGAEDTIVDQWQSQIFARLLLRATVIYVSDAPDETVTDLHMIPAHSLEKAISKADELLRRKYGDTFRGRILAIPDGVSVIVE